jgi:hypothetical protein
MPHASPGGAKWQRFVVFFGRRPIHVARRAHRGGGGDEQLICPIHLGREKSRESTLGISRLNQKLLRIRRRMGCRFARRVRQRKYLSDQESGGASCCTIRLFLLVGKKQ